MVISMNWWGCDLKGNKKNEYQKGGMFIDLNKSELFVCFDGKK